MNPKWKKIVLHRFFIIGLVFLFFYLGSKFSPSPLEISFCHLTSFTLSKTMLNVISEISMNAALLLIFYCFLDVNRRYTAILELSDELESKYFQFNSKLIDYIARRLEKEENNEEALNLANRIKKDLLISTTHKYDYFNKTSHNLKNIIKSKLLDIKYIIFFEATTVINTINKILELDFISNKNKNNLLQIKKDLNLIEPTGLFGNYTCAPLDTYLFNEDKHLILEDQIYKIIEELKNIHSLQ